ncbi:TfoX/Sxy family protein [bacterium]|nr:TfoX/Sxy family protein [bacterium]
MKMPEPTARDKTWFQSLVPDDPGVVVKPMFGNLGAFVNGNMFMGLFGPDVGVRLEQDDRDELGELDGTGPFGPEGRPMKEYVALPRTWRGSPERAGEWIDRSLAHVAAMPPKMKG